MLLIATGIGIVNFRIREPTVTVTSKTSKEPVVLMKEP